MLLALRRRRLAKPMMRAADGHPRYLDALLAASGADTVLTTAFGVGWPDAPHRVLRSAVDAAAQLEGDVAGTTSILSADGVSTIGFIDYHQSRHGDLLKAVRIARFVDGSSDEDQATANAECGHPFSIGPGF